MLVVASSAVARAEGGLPLRLPVFGESALSITSTSIVEYRFDNFDRNPYDDGFLALTQRLEAGIAGEELSLSVRLDGFVPALQDDCPPESVSLCFLETDVRPERATLRWQRDDLTIEAGDSYVVLGRGIALSFRKVDILGIDTTVRGGHVVFDSHRFVARAVAGVSNPQNLDPRTLRIIDEPTDVVLAAELGTRIGADDDLEIGVHALRIWFEEDRDLEQDATVDVIGWRAQANGLFDGRLTLYGEVDALRRRVESGFTGNRRELGRAVYGSAQLSIDLLTVLVEWKDYRDFVVALSNGEGFAHRIYGAPPTIERDGQPIRAIGSSRGGGIGVEQGFGGGPWSVSVHGLLYGLAEEEDQDPWDGILVAHGYGGLRRRSEGASGIDWTLDVVGGYRRETYLHDPPEDDVGEGDLDWETIHGEIEAGIAAGQHSFELRLEHRIERRRTFDYTDYVRGGATLTYAFGGVLSVSPILRWDTEREEAPSIYPAGEARVTFGSGSFVRVFGGRTPGGRLCSGGICRDVPPFEGVLGELVLRL